MTFTSAAVVAVTGTTPHADVAAPVAASRAAGVAGLAPSAARTRDTARHAHAGRVNNSAT